MDISLILTLATGVLLLCGSVASFRIIFRFFSLSSLGPAPIDRGTTIFLCLTGIGLVLYFFGESFFDATFYYKGWLIGVPIGVALFPVFWIALWFGNAFFEQWLEKRRNDREPRI